MEIGRQRTVRSSKSFGATLLASGLAAASFACAGDPASPVSPSSPVPLTPDPGGAGWFIWTKATGLTLMSGPAGVRKVSPTDVNSRGDVVGSMLVEAGGTIAWHAFTWSPSRGYRDLGPAVARPGEPVGESAATHTFGLAERRWPDPADCNEPGRESGRDGLLTHSCNSAEVQSN